MCALVQFYCKQRGWVSVCVSTIPECAADCAEVRKFHQIVRAVMFERF